MKRFTILLGIFLLMAGCGGGSGDNQTCNGIPSSLGLWFLTEDSCETLTDFEVVEEKCEDQRLILRIITKSGKELFGQVTTGSQFEIQDINGDRVCLFRMNGNFTIALGLCFTDFGTFFEDDELCTANYER